MQHASVTATNTTTTSSTVGSTSKIVFLTTNIYPATAAGINGLVNADSICNADSAKPAGKTFKALLGVTSTRESTGTDWVFAANQAYKRSDGTEIGSTDTNKVFTSLTSGFCSGTNANGYFGLSLSGSNWVASSNNCSNWLSGAGNGQFADLTTQSLPTLLSAASTVNCTTSLYFCCVEQ